MPDFFRITRISPPAIAHYPPAATFGPRSLMDYEFVWMMEGNAQYINNDVTISVPEGSFVLCRPGSTDAFVWDTKRRTRHGYCHFTVDNFSPLFPAPSAWPTLRMASEVKVLEPVFLHLISLAKAAEPSSLDSALALLITAFVTGGDDTARKASHLPDAIESVIGFIQERLNAEPDGKITLESMAKVGYCSKEHLCRLFNGALGVTPAEWVRLERLERAATMLARSNYTVAEISLIYGFSNPSHFTKRFLEAYGFPPSEFRNIVRSGGKTPTSRISR